MQVTRMDLADTGSPEGLVTAILRCEKNLPVPVPIEDLCYQLDIAEIDVLETEGFEGGLMTDTARSHGIVLVNKDSRSGRRRFTIGHELGHFLMPSHVPDAKGRFLCSRKDMALLGAKESDRRAKMEVEANRFSSLILMPPPLLRPRLTRKVGPSIESVLDLADEFEVSKQAMAHAYAKHHQEAVAFVVVQQGVVRGIYRSQQRFPFITVRPGQPVPQGSIFHKPRLRQLAPSEIDSRVPDLWIDVERGRAAPRLCEQVCLQANGFAMIMLWYEPAEEENEESDERTARQRWRDNQDRWG